MGVQSLANSDGFGFLVTVDVPEPGPDMVAPRIRAKVDTWREASVLDYRLRHYVSRRRGVLVVDGIPRQRGTLKFRVMGMEQAVEVALVELSGPVSLVVGGDEARSLRQFALFAELTQQAAGLGRAMLRQCIGRNASAKDDFVTNVVAFPLQGIRRPIR